MRDAGDTPPEMSRLTVDEAAQALGISTGAVRNRLSRGTLDSAKEDGTVYVLLPSDMSRDTDDTPGDIPHEYGALISAKDETIRVLREQLESERAASAELRRIVAGLVQRVPELEAASEPRNGPETTSDGPGSGTGPEEERRRTWWRRLFGS